MFKFQQLTSVAAMVMGLAFGMPQATAAPISVNVVGTPAAVAIDDAFSVDIVVSGITNEIVSAWDIDVAFDPFLLQNVSVTFPLVLFGGGDTFLAAVFDNVTGLTDAFLLSLLNDADLQALQCPGGICAPSLTIASLGFEAIADGSALIELVNWGTTDDNTNDIKGASIDGIPQVIFPSAAVPEPATLALVAAALAGMFVPATRRRRQVTAGA